MSNSFTRVAPDSTGDKIDTEEITGLGPTGTDTVQRQRVQIAGAAAADIATIGAGTPAAGDRGLTIKAEVLGAQADAAVDGDVNGSIAAKLRGLGKIFTDVWVDALNALGVVLRPATSGGLSAPFHLISAATTNLTNVKNAAGQLYGWHITNTNAAWRYVKIHNNAGAPTAGAGVVMTIGVPPGGGTNDSFEHGIAFATGIAISTVTGIADADTAAVGAGDLNINLLYK